MSWWAALLAEGIERETMIVICLERETRICTDTAATAFERERTRDRERTRETEREKQTERECVCERESERERESDKQR